MKLIFFFLSHIKNHIPVLVHPNMACLLFGCVNHFSLICNTSCRLAGCICSHSLQQAQPGAVQSPLFMLSQLSHCLDQCGAWGGVPVN